MHDSQLHVSGAVPTWQIYMTFMFGDIPEGTVAKRSGLHNTILLILRVLNQSMIFCNTDVWNWNEIQTYGQTTKSAASKEWTPDSCKDLLRTSSLKSEYPNL